MSPPDAADALSVCASVTAGNSPSALASCSAASAAIATCFFFGTGALPVGAAPAASCGPGEAALGLEATAPGPFDGDPGFFPASTAAEMPLAVAETAPGLAGDARESAARLAAGGCLGLTTAGKAGFESWPRALLGLAGSMYDRLRGVGATDWVAE